MNMIIIKNKKFNITKNKKNPNLIRFVRTEGINHDDISDWSMLCYMFGITDMGFSTRPKIEDILNLVKFRISFDGMELNEIGSDYWDYLRFVEYKTKKPASNSELFFQLKYGDRWTIKKNEFLKSKPNMYSVEDVMKKKNLTASQAISWIENYKNKTKPDLNTFKRKYGEHLGKIKYTEKCEKDAFRNTLAGKIDLYGEEYGLEKYKIQNKKNSFSKTLEGFKIRYGFEIGEELYHTYCNDRDSRSFEYCLGKMSGDVKKAEILYNHLSAKKDGSSKSFFLKKFNNNEELAHIAYLESSNKKDSSSLQFFLKKCDGDLEESFKQYKNTIIKKTVSLGKASKISLSFFIPLYDILIKIGFHDEDLFFGYENKKEFFLYNEVDRQIRFYDFAIKSKKILIEFDGLVFHPQNEIIAEEELQLWKSPFGVSGLIVRRNDSYKNELAAKKGFRLVRINEKTDLNDFLTEIEKIINEN